MTEIMEKKQGEAVSTVEPKGMMEAIEVEKVGEAAVFETPPCNVGVQASALIPTGNYANVKVGVSLHIPCAHGEIDKVFEFAEAWVDKKMEKLCAKL